MAGEIPIVVNRGLTIGGQFVGGTTESVLYADYQVVYRQDIATGSVDYEIDFPVTALNIVATAFSSTRHVTINTNDIHSGSPDQTFDVPAGTTLVYTQNDPDVMALLTGDVTKFYVTNSSGATATVTIAVAAKQAPTGSA